MPNKTEKINFFFYLTICLFSWVSYSGILSLPLWIGSVSDSMHGASEYVGYIASAQLAFAAMSAFALAFFVNLLDLKKTTLFSLLLLLIANLLSANSTEIGLLILGRSLSGIAEGMMLALLNTFIMRSKNSDKLFAFSQTMVAVFSIFLFGLVPNLTTFMGSSTTFYWVAFVGFIAFLAAISTKFVGEPIKTTTHKHSLNIVSILALVAIGLIFVGLQGAWAYMERMGIAKDFTLKEIGYLLVIGQFIGLTGPSIAIWLGKSMGYLKILVMGIALSALTIIFASQNLPHYLFTFSILFFHLGTLSMITTMLVYLSILDPSGKAATLAPTAINVGSLFGPAIATVMLSHFDYAGIGWMTIFFYLVALVCLWFCSEKSPLKKLV